MGCQLIWYYQLAFYDFNVATNARNKIFTVATFYPLWSGIIPDEVLSGQDKAFGFFSSLNLVLNRYNGTYPTTFIQSGQQWWSFFPLVSLLSTDDILIERDAPNSWPPHNYIVLEALRTLPSNVTGGPLPIPSDKQSTFNLIPNGQLGLEESQLPGQPVRAGSNASTTGPEADINRMEGTVANGGKASDGEGWGKTLGRELANRYMASAFCSWCVSS